MSVINKLLSVHSNLPNFSSDSCVTLESCASSQVVTCLAGLAKPTATSIATPMSVRTRGVYTLFSRVRPSAGSIIQQATVADLLASARCVGIRFRSSLLIDGTPGVIVGVTNSSLDTQSMLFSTDLA